MDSIYFILFCIVLMDSIYVIVYPFLQYNLFLCYDVTTGAVSECPRGPWRVPGTETLYSLKHFDSVQEALLVVLFDHAGLFYVDSKYQKLNLRHFKNF